MKLHIIKQAFNRMSILLILLITACDTTKKIASNNEFTLLTYNIHHANPPSKPGVIDIDAICNVLKLANADVIALQEVDVRTNRSDNIDEAKEIAKQLGMSYHFFKAIDHDGGDYGLAILSKLPMKNPQTIALPQVEKAEQRILALVQVKVKNKWVYIANTHLDALRSHKNRLAQMQFIMNKTSAIKLPILLCGDLNSLPTSEAIGILDKHFTRTCLDDCLPTVPQTTPRNTIDYVAIKNSSWQQKSIEVIEETYASDHRPIKVIFGITK